ncbi:hypothetical protein C1701_16520 [Actinoalloteichus sp. AHMU CJ021]|uniref:DUF3558 domain-containing protein n=1 Tax=Actinoalloteichus sp. AHMU CJ021 TaxID=2072503 RepID=UPI000CA05596|nr:hypothetical protein C1701_16520 [Actinoalloteichus sp. AHMU CJ021]
MLVATACSSEGSGTPGTTGQSTVTQSLSTVNTSETEDGPGSGAPTVADPLDVSAVAPCDLIPDSAAEQAGLDSASKRLRPNHRDPNAPEEMCRWDFNNMEYSSISAIANIDRGGLSSVYATSSGRTVFEPMSIAGYPAVHVNDSSNSARCPLFLGVADDQTILFDTQLSASATEDACEMAVRVVEAAVAELASASQE